MDPWNDFYNELKAQDTKRAPACALPLASLGMKNGDLGHKRFALAVSVVAVWEQLVNTMRTGVSDYSTDPHHLSVGRR